MSLSHTQSRSEFQKSSTESLHGHREYQKTLATVAVAAALIGGGGLVDRLDDQAERNNQVLHEDMSSILSAYANQDSRPGIAIVDGKNVTVESLKKEKTDANKKVELRFSRIQSVTVSEGEKPGDVLWETFSSDTYSPDSISPLHTDETLDQSEQIMLTIIHGNGDELSPDISRKWLSQIETLNNAIERGDSTIKELEDELEEEVKDEANKAFAGQSTIVIPNPSN